MAKFSRLKFLHTYIINSYFIGVKQTVPKTQMARMYGQT